MMRLEKQSRPIGHQKQGFLLEAMESHGNPQYDKSVLAQSLMGCMKNDLKIKCIREEIGKT